MKAAFADQKAWRNMPCYLDTVAHVDLTEFPIKIKLETPKLLWGALNQKEIKTGKVIVQFVEQKEESL